MIRTTAFVAVALAAATCIGCTSGIGGEPPTPAARRDLPPEGRDLPGGSRDNGTASRDNPAGSRDPAGEPSSICPSCAMTYACDIVTGAGGTGAATIQLKTAKNGLCAFDGESSGPFFSCDRTIAIGATDTRPAMTIGWEPYGEGGFAFEVDGSQLRCVPDSHLMVKGSGDGTSSTPASPGATQSN